MLKKKMLIALGVAAVLSVSCVSVTVWAEENAEEQTEEAEDSSNRTRRLHKGGFLVQKWRQ